MENSIRYVNIEDLLPGEFQAHFENIGDNLDNLVNSISKYGIIVPLIVREKGVNQYEIILGNRRYSAARIAGLKEIPVIVFNVDDEKALDIVISENIQRKELSAKEEANLYEKDLEYTNNNEEQLSNKLGIPIDRILSKLSFIRKSNSTNINNQNNNQNVKSQINSISTNSSINQDIINLTELNKEEREEDNMNNEIINNQKLNTDPSKTPQQPQEPTFGGRFFPSLEDEPTNMNMNQNISAFNTPNSSNQNQEPLIDLTNDNNNENIQENYNNIPNNIPASNNNQIINTNVSTDIQQESPAVPNLDVLSNSIIDNPNTTIPQNIAATSVPEPINNEQVVTDNLTTNMTNNISISSDNITPQQNTGNYQELNQQPIASTSINSLPQNNNDSLSVENIEQTMQPQTELNQQNIENSINEMPIDNNIANPSISENINSANSIQQQNIVPELNQQTSTDNIAPTKDIIPVINMIKSLAVNIENLGYNLNITENENEGSYSINIEVEK